LTSRAVYKDGCNNKHGGVGKAETIFVDENERGNKACIIEEKNTWVFKEFFFNHTSSFIRFQGGNNSKSQRTWKLVNNNRGKRMWAEEWKRQQKNWIFF
jgi:hypothetical protein